MIPVQVGRKIYRFENGEMVTLTTVAVDSEKHRIIMDNGKKFSYNSVGFIFEENKNGNNDRGD